MESVEGGVDAGIRSYAGWFRHYVLRHGKRHPGPSELVAKARRDLPVYAILRR